VFSSRERGCSSVVTKKGRLPEITFAPASGHNKRSGSSNVCSQGEKARKCSAEVAGNVQAAPIMSGWLAFLLVSK